MLERLGLAARGHSASALPSIGRISLTRVQSQYNGFMDDAAMGPIQEADNELDASMRGGRRFASNGSLTTTAAAALEACQQQSGGGGSGKQPVGVSPNGIALSINDSAGASNSH